MEGLKAASSSGSGDGGSTGGEYGSSDAGASSSSGGGEAGGGDEQQPVWECRLAGGGSVRGRSIVLATGGLSFPAVGTDGTGACFACFFMCACHRMTVNKLGRDQAKTYAALMPLLLYQHTCNHQTCPCTGHRIVKKVGHDLAKTYAALTPLLLVSCKCSHAPTTLHHRPPHC